MIMMIALALISAAPIDDEEAIREVKAAQTCIDETSAKLAKASTEGAEVLADLVVYRCNDGTVNRRAAMSILPVRKMAIDAIVKARTGI